MTSSRAWYNTSETSKSGMVSCTAAFCLDSCRFCSNCSRNVLSTLWRCNCSSALTKSSDLVKKIGSISEVGFGTVRVFGAGAVAAAAPDGPSTEVVVVCELVGSGADGADRGGCSRGDPPGPRVSATWGCTLGGLGGFRGAALRTNCCGTFNLG